MESVDLRERLFFCIVSTFRIIVMLLPQDNQPGKSLSAMQPDNWGIECHQTRYL